jgi:hypothetical protein
MAALFRILIITWFSRGIHKPPGPAASLTALNVLRRHVQSFSRTVSCQLLSCAAAPILDT